MKPVAVPAEEPDRPDTAAPADAADPGVGDISSSVPMKSLRSTMRGVLSIVAPTTLVVALHYYFGWARTSAEAHALGLDDSLFGYSSQDYVLRSISSMFWPLFIGAVALLAGLAMHGLITGWLADDPPDPHRIRYARILMAVLAIVGLVLVVLGTIGANVDRPSRFVSLAAPVAVTISVVVLAYAAHLLFRYGPGLGRGELAREARPLAPVAWSLVVVLFFLSAFWTVSHYAGIRGVDLAAQADQQIAFQPNVTIYSAKRLYLEPPVTETVLPDAGNAAYRYRYGGLKLLFRSDHDYFLRPSDPSDQRNIVVADSPDLRFEFSPG
jgi:hypothetical protein